MCNEDLPGPILVSAEGDHILQLEDGDMEQVFFTDLGLLRLHPNEEIENTYLLEILHSHE